MILSENRLVIEVAQALHRAGNGCRLDIDGVADCAAWTPDPHESEAEYYVRTNAHYLSRCLVHGGYVPCPTCQSYIAAGL